MNSLKKLIVLLSSLTVCLNAQNEELLAEELFASERYGEAEVIYSELLKNHPQNALYHYRNGICYLHSRSQKHKAISHLEKAIEHSPHFKTKNHPGKDEAPDDAYNFLGEAYRVNYRFDEALSAFEKHRELLDPKKEQGKKQIAKNNQCKDLCKFGKEVQQNSWPAEININELTKQVKLNGSFTSTLSPDKSQMIYSWRVPVSGDYSGDDSKYFESTGLPTSKSDSGKKITGKEPHKKTRVKEQDTIVNITTIGTSVDGQIMLTYYNEKGSACIYISKLIGNKWSDPTRLPKTANKNGWEPCEYVSFDGNHLYFVSSRPGGYGGKDIYRCKRLADGEWSRAENLGPGINSEYDEEAPFLHEDGTTLYFSSNRNKPEKSFDIYASTFDKNNWSKPQIVGYPINSSEEDIFYQVASDKRRIYAQAVAPQPGKTKVKEPRKKNRSDKKGSDKGNNFLITFTNPQMSSLTVLKGQVAEKQKKKQIPVQATITVTDNYSGKCQGVYFADQGRGHYSFIVPAGKNNNITYKAEGYLFSSENLCIKPETNYFENKEPVQLQRLKEGSSSILNNIFFEKEQAVIEASSKTELDNLYSFLEEHPGLKINVISRIYSGEKYYKPLSQQRAEAVVKYLEDKGIDKKRMKAKGLRESPPDKGKNSLTADGLVQKIEIEITDLPKPKKNS